MTTAVQPSHSPVVPRLTVRTSDDRTFRMVRPFVIGRETDCDIRIEDGRVSRKHATVSFDEGHWIVRDRQSGNGVFVDGRRVETAIVDGKLTLTLGPDGPSITLEVEPPPGARLPSAPAPVRSETVLLASLAEVGSYIRRWQSTQRFARSINRAQTMGYTRKIVEAFQKQNLPPQFFYLALQESDFNEVASGPPTRWGIAKGMWQLIPDTAKRYGLT